MSVIDKASLIQIPSGYKEDKLYSVKPTDGSGDFNFTRASSATRVNSDGLIETASVLGSELIVNGDFASGTGWSLVGDFAIGGGKASITSASQYSQLTSQGTNFLTSGNKYKLQVDIDTLSISGSFAYRFTGGAVTPILTSQIVDGKFEAIFTMPSNGYIWFQTTGAYTGLNVSIDNVSVKEVIENDVPRIDYTGGGCGKLLLEPQRTNTIQQSVPNGSYFTLTEITMDLNSATSPDGENNAVRLTPTTVSSSHRMYKSSQPISGGRYSVFAKSNGYDYILLTSHPGSAPSARGAYFNIANGTIGSEGNGIVAEIEDYGNGWYRCIINAGTSASSIFSVFAIETDGTTTFAGDGTKGVYIWGAQNEQGDFASSYIPTSGATATRVGDVCNGAGTSATFNSTEGVLYAEIAALADDGTVRAIYISNGTTSNRLWIEFDSSSNRFEARYIVGGVTSANFFHTVSDTTDYNKIAFKWKVNDFSLYVNGTKVATDTSGQVIAADTLNRIDFHNQANSSIQNFYGNVKQLIVFDEALTDTELATLTTI